MDGKNWEFKGTKPIADLDDMMACGNAYSQFSAKCESSPLKMNEAEWDVFIFNAGFMRGMQWQRDRSKEGE